MSSSQPAHQPVHGASRCRRVGRVGVRRRELLQPHQVLHQPAHLRARRDTSARNVLNEKEPPAALHVLVAAEEVPTRLSSAQRTQNVLNEGSTLSQGTHRAAPISHLPAQKWYVPSQTLYFWAVGLHGTTVQGGLDRNKISGLGRKSSGAKVRKS